MAAEAIDSESDLKTGHLLAGKYRLETEIGRGAMGTVWSAVHVSLGQRVAIKVISSEHADSDELRRRFDTEARAAAKLRSRFVVGVFDHGTTPGGLPYIVMEFLEGECLEDRIARFGVISLPEAARITRHVGRALTRAHAHGIVHRDLKPANIFITKAEEDDDGDWIAKVLDFGIAKTEDFSDRSTTKTGTVLGTPLFMSPEQVRGASSVDNRADLYSLGMVIYNMLTGTYAFEGQSFGDLLVSICTDPLPSLTSRAPTLPIKLDAWFQKACARDVGVRFQTADELVRGFDEAIGDMPGRVSLAESSVQTLRNTDHLAATYAADSSSELSGAHAVLNPPRSNLASASPSTLTVPGMPTARSSRSRVLIGVSSVLALVGLVVVIRGFNSQPTEVIPTPLTRPEIVLDTPTETVKQPPEVLPTEPVVTPPTSDPNPNPNRVVAARPRPGQKPSPVETKPPIEVKPDPVKPPETKPPGTGVPDVGF